MPTIIILSPDADGFELAKDRFEESIVDGFGAQAASLVPRAGDESPVDVAARIDRPGEPAFQIFHFRTGDSISTDGTDEQAVEVMLWARSILPDDPGGRIWAVDEAYNGHVELRTGMTKDDIEASRVDHAVDPPELLQTPRECTR
ncbi:hypothetical protein F1D05_09885 [Kribbella qitaiheensis]|uniref:Uncharacterized protein n=1 Tax=Kribbella qitaiheensis TaxID=1544730 RepID=A0A7G6WVX8_9ACTN|nr:hypothetical protein [Kribbella qitaiheensis]QNE18143.1 hypothetical protein F1D05_09885 [Kribbella qitaiheensis]